MPGLTADRRASGGNTGRASFRPQIILCPIDNRLSFVHGRSGRSFGRHLAISDPSEKGSSIASGFIAKTLRTSMPLDIESARRRFAI